MGTKKEGKVKAKINGSTKYLLHLLIYRLYLTNDLQEGYDDQGVTWMAPDYPDYQEHTSWLARHLTDKLALLLFLHIGIGEIHVWWSHNFCQSPDFLNPAMYPLLKYYL